jgi:hypothetical protein
MCDKFSFRGPASQKLDAMISEHQKRVADIKKKYHGEQPVKVPQYERGG